MLLALLAAGLSCAGAPPNLVLLSVDTLRERMRSVPDLVLVDVRNPGEIELGTIEGSRTISLPALLTRLDDLDDVAVGDPAGRTQRDAHAHPGHRFGGELGRDPVVEEAVELRQGRIDHHPGDGRNHG